MVIFQCLLRVHRRHQRQQMMNCLIWMRKRRVVCLFTHGIGWARVSSRIDLWGLKAMTSHRRLSPLGDRIFMKIVVPCQGQSSRPLPSRRLVTIDQQIQRNLENRIRLQPGSYALIIFDEQVIYIIQLEGRRQTKLMTAFTSCAKYVVNCVVWHSSPR